MEMFRVSTFAEAQSKRAHLRRLLSGWELKRPLNPLNSRWPVTLEVAGSSPVAPAKQATDIVAYFVCGLAAPGTRSGSGKHQGSTKPDVKRLSWAAPAGATVGVPP